MAALQPQLLSFLFFLSVLSSVSTCLGALLLPQVDLGYSITQAVDYAGDFYSFNNIRYAEPPIGELRFRAPVAPVTIDRSVNDGSQGVVCPQASPDWIDLGTRAASARTDEDCLFLDVVVSRGGFNSREEIGVMPVLVWIHGGGYVMGDKSSSSSSSSGLLHEAMKHIKYGKGVVFVSINYRLGLFGWLSGPTLGADGTSNAGLLDQRLALQWVQKHINSFGGNPNEVTLMGVSAGGGSVLHQITAYGGVPPAVENATRLFHRAIVQSPGFDPIPSTGQEEDLFRTFLATAQVSSTEEARALDTETLQAVNQKMVAPAPYGTFTFNPVVDGTLVPDLPGKLLLRGAFDQNLTLLIGHTTDEGSLFTNPATNSSGAFETEIRLLFPTISAATLAHITQVLYPPLFSTANATRSNDGPSLPSYANQYDRAKLLLAESIFSCNTDYLARAVGNQSYNYLFAGPPGTHGQDVAYTYFVPNATAAPRDAFARHVTTPVNATVAARWQGYIVRFAATGNPNGGGAGAGPSGDGGERDGENGGGAGFAVYGPEGRAEMVGGEGDGTMVADPARNARCEWWQAAFYFAAGNEGTAVVGGAGKAAGC